MNRTIDPSTSVGPERTSAQERTTSAPSLAYYHAGQTGPLVLLVMGFCMPGRAWDPLVRALRHDHRLLYFDHAGTGCSAPLEGPVRMADLAEHVVAVLDAAGAAQAHLVGVSMGGMAAQVAALAYPSRWRSLTLITTHAGGPLAWLPPVATQGRIASMMWASDRRRQALISEILFPPAFRARHADVVAQRMKDQFRARPLASTRRWQLRAVMGHRTADRLHRLTLPTLVVRAGRDALIPPPRVDRLHKLIPGAKLARFPDAGHGIIVQSTAPLAARLRTHFAQAERAAEAGS